MELNQNVKEKKKWIKVIRNITLSIIAVFLLLLVSGFVYDTIASMTTKKNYPAPGELVNVGENTIHLQIKGNGEQIVVLEAASGAGVIDWFDLPEQLSKNATVVTYDRAGYGWSGESKTDRTAENIVEDLRSALKEKGLEGPYVLVGSSIGGMYTRAFAKEYPSEVAGMVLLDARTEDMTLLTKGIFEKNKLDPILPGQPSPAVTSFLAKIGLFRILGPSIAVTEDYKERNLGEIQMNVTYRPKFFRVLFNEAEKLSNVGDAIRNQSLGDIPLTVISHGISLAEDAAKVGLSKEDGQEMEEIWQEQQKKLLSLSSNSKHVIAQNSGHLIHQYEPELIVEEVKAVLDNLE
ncbi:alpha/beta hydrolase [Bacillus sp. 31A1R]|uniref:Alpha/beta hydrolase n=1 Tax=Robertmurraya mangrovi TaxID=3098077 RepID=A0ABU5IX08_9BACI|nr:alpha/beta hydrolase [Bacillus sp. 31A1R]MDZ5471684.1 alpha/beta hydrolase [Bacillus sp. 31A1R]